MLDLKFIRAHPETVARAIEQKGVPLDLPALLAADETVTALRQERQSLQQRRNQNAEATRAAPPEERPPLKEAGREIQRQLQRIAPRLEEAEDALRALLLLVPNIPAPDAPVGLTEAENREIKRHGTIPTFAFPVRDQMELLERNGWAQFERVTKTAGPRNYALGGDLLLLEMALWRFALDRLARKGFKTLSVPALCREEALVGTGHFPTGKDQNYFLAEDHLYLAGTAEVVLNGLHRDEILKEEDLPILYAGFSPCYRREAGSAGKDVRGLVRVHQFFKVEQFVLCANDLAESELWGEKLLQTSEEILQALELPYRIIETCTGDMGAGKYRMRDIETWVPSENRYRETHSCSLLLDWQARRTNLRYRGKDGEVRFCHTLNNTAIATPRVLVPLLENHQTKEGAVKIPAALQPYLDGAREIPRPEDR